MFGRSSAAAPVPKPMIKRRASPLKESPARDEEDETSDCPMEQVADENQSASQQPENVNMEQVDYDPDSDDDDSDARRKADVKGDATSETCSKVTATSIEACLQGCASKATSDAACSHIQSSVVCNIWIKPPEVRTLKILCTSATGNAQPSLMSFRISTSFLSMRDHMELRCSG